MVAGAGFEPYDLRVMSPTSYQAAPPRDILAKGIISQKNDIVNTFLSFLFENLLVWSFFLF